VRCLCRWRWCRYIKAWQQFQKISSLIDAVAKQQLKLEARREHLHTLMNALSTTYKIVRGHRRLAQAAAGRAAVSPPLRHSAVVPVSVDADCHIAAAPDCWTSVADTPSSAVAQPAHSTVEDLSGVADGKATVPAVAYDRRTSTGYDCFHDDGFAAADTALVAAHTTRNRVEISWTSLDSPPPAHSAKVDITAYTYIVRNHCDATARV